MCGTSYADSTDSRDTGPRRCRGTETQRKQAPFDWLACYAGQLRVGRDREHKPRVDPYWLVFAVSFHAQRLRRPVERSPFAPDETLCVSASLRFRFS